MSWLITAAQADKFRKSQKSLIILDASLHMPNAGRDAKQEFAEKHIPGAQFFDIDVFSDPNSDIPHALITDEKLISEKLGAMGIRNDYKIIFYDDSDLHSASRAVWMMKMFGHNPQQLYIIDGGFTAWERTIGKTEVGKSSVTPKQYKATLQPQFLRTLAQMKDNCKNPREQVIDVRHSLRFAGGREVRPGLRSGHIPGSYSYPFTVMFDKTGKFVPVDKLRSHLINVGIDLRSPIVATCGSGITAPILDFVLDLMGHKQHAVYAGSWTEWGAEKLYPGEVSLDERPVKTSAEFDEPPKIL